MECPLFCIGNYSVELMKENPAFNCLQADCAWWDERHGCCGERTKRLQTERIADKLNMIAKELTPIRP
ncbi:unnamed protein product, partial [marine sediment metagenome]